MAKKSAKDGPDDDGFFVCQWCGREYQTARGLRYHEKVCEYRPTDDDDDDGPADGIDIFGDGDAGGAGVNTPGDDGGPDEYECPDCGHVAAAAFPVCPVCGAVLAW